MLNYNISVSYFDSISYGHFFINMKIYGHIIIHRSKVELIITDFGLPSLIKGFEVQYRYMVSLFLLKRPQVV